VEYLIYLNWGKLTESKFDYRTFSSNTMLNYYFSRKLKLIEKGKFNHLIITLTGTTFDRSFIGSFKIPLASLSAFVTISMLVTVLLYDHFFVKIMRRWTKNPRGITILQRMGIGLYIYIIMMIIASLANREI
jgi:hypothetical protein